MTVMMAAVSIPVCLGIGLALDYGQGSNQRSSMQSALDAAALAALQLPPSATRSEREGKLQEFFVANGGKGSAVMNGDIVKNSDGATLSVSASYDMPTTLMRLAGRTKVDIKVHSQVQSAMALERAKFRLKRVTGLWDKKITLMGRHKNESVYKPLVSLTYNYNGKGQNPDKGIGTTTLSTISGAATTDIFRISCATSRLSQCTEEKLKDDGAAEVVVIDMDDMYLQMEIWATDAEGKKWLKGLPTMIRSNDPALSDRMFVAGKQMPKGKVVNIQDAIGCGDNLEQRWEDGGGYDKNKQTPWEGADFWYDVEGKCSWGGTRVARLVK